MIPSSPAHAGAERMVLAIAGSDPSGGAGLQADLKTFAALGVYGGAAVTCLTVQNTRGVKSFEPLPADLVAAQITAVLEDMPVTHIKTGMMGNGAIAAAVGEILSSFRGEIVCDPVLVSSSGTPLLDPEDIASFTVRVAARATVLTPNLSELEVLADRRCVSEKDITAAAGRLFSSLPNLRALSVKGGHFRENDSSATDFFFLRPDRQEQPPAMERATHPRLVTANTHGTGCTFASAFAAFHLLGGDYGQAFRQASAFLHHLLAASSGAALGSGRGPLLHHLWHPEG